MDEFEIEVTPLDGADNGDTPDWAWSGGDTARSPFAPRLTRRGKLLRTVTAWGTVLLACIFIVSTSPSLRNTLGSFVHRSAPTKVATIPPGAEMIYFEHSVPWGKLSIDGHGLADPTDANTDSIAVAQGRHTLIYGAPPFAPLVCHFQVPISAQDNCPLEFNPPAPPAQSELYVRVIDLGATPNRLPSSQTAALANVMDGALGVLGSRTFMLAGTPYLTTARQVATTSQALVASLVFRLNADPRIVVPYLPGGFLCSQICYLGDASSTPSGWGILAVVHVTWNYAKPQGAPLVQGAPATPIQDGSIALIPMSVTWDGAWHATASPGQSQFGMSPLCEIANDLLPTEPSTGSDSGAFAQTIEIPAAVAADGCLLITHGDHPQTTANNALVLYRFGVLFAANDEAHQLYPGLPSATPQDRAIAQNLANTAGVGG